MPGAGLRRPLPWEGHEAASELGVGLGIRGSGEPAALPADGSDGVVAIFIDSLDGTTFDTLSALGDTVLASATFN